MRNKNNFLRLNYIVNMLSFQLFSRITKQGWFDSSKDNFVFRNVTSDVGQFLQVTNTLLIPGRVYSL